MKAMIIFLVFVMQSAAQLLFAQNLTIEVCDIEKVEGHLYVAIYNSEETFMKKPLTAFRIDVKDTSLSIPCQGLPTGTYAISLFQDENGNGKLDTAVFGIPTHLISDEDKNLLKEELLSVVDDLEELAARGKSKTGNDIKIYISNINFEATYSYLETDTIQLSLIRIYSINSITTQDSEMFRGLKEWIQSLKKFSTLISESGEMQRIQFFKQQREIIDAL